MTMSRMDGTVRIARPCHPPTPPAGQSQGCMERAQVGHVVVKRNKQFKTDTATVWDFRSMSGEGGKAEGGL
eukprot:315271-Chlamydomonas_euryale.AAC.1